MLLPIFHILITDFLSHSMCGTCQTPFKMLFLMWVFPFSNLPSLRDKTAQFIAVSHIILLYFYFIKVNIIQRVFSIALYRKKSELKLSMEQLYD